MTTVGKLSASGALTRSRGCRVPGCQQELLPGYSFKYKICLHHNRMDSLELDGHTQRFCQQCGRFHPLDDFLGDRRSCRASLVRHRQRRLRAEARRQQEHEKQQAKKDAKGAAGSAGAKQPAKRGGKRCAVNGAGAGGGASPSAPAQAPRRKRKRASASCAGTAKKQALEPAVVQERVPAAAAVPALDTDTDRESMAVVVPPPDKPPTPARQSPMPLSPRAVPRPAAPAAGLLRASYAAVSAGQPSVPLSGGAASVGGLQQQQQQQAKGQYLLEALGAFADPTMSGEEAAHDELPSTEELMGLSIGLEALNAPLSGGTAPSADASAEFWPPAAPAARQQGKLGPPAGQALGVLWHPAHAAHHAGHAGHHAGHAGHHAGHGTLPTVPSFDLAALLSLPLECPPPLPQGSAAPQSLAPLQDASWSEGAPPAVHAAAGAAHAAPGIYQQRFAGGGPAGASCANFALHPSIFESWDEDDWFLDAGAMFAPADCSNQHRG